MGKRREGNRGKRKRNEMRDGKEVVVWNFSPLLEEKGEGKEKGKRKKKKKKKKRKREREKKREKERERERERKRKRKEKEKEKEKERKRKRKRKRRWFFGDCGPCWCWLLVVNIVTNFLHR